MNDTYVECLVSCKQNPLTGVAKFILYGLAIACFIWMMLGWGIMIIPTLIFTGVAYFVMPMFDIEYEYLYLEKELSIDKVISKERRKNVATIDLNKVEKIAPANSHELDSAKARPHKDIDYTSKYEDAKVYIALYESGNGLELIHFEPNEEMLKAIKMVFPRKVVEY